MHTVQYIVHKSNFIILFYKKLSKMKKLMLWLKKTKSLFSLIIRVGVVVIHFYIIAIWYCEICNYPTSNFIDSFQALSDDCSQKLTFDINKHDT